MSCDERDALLCLCLALRLALGADFLVKGVSCSPLRVGKRSHCLLRGFQKCVILPPSFPLSLANDSNPRTTVFGVGRTWLPDCYSQIFRSYVFGPSGFWTTAPLRYAAKFDAFLSLDCARVEGVGAQSNFAIWQPWGRMFCCALRFPPAPKSLIVKAGRRSFMKGRIGGLT